MDKKEEDSSNDKMPDFNAKPHTEKRTIKGNLMTPEEIKNTAEKRIEEMKKKANKPKYDPVYPNDKTNEPDPDDYKYF